MVQVGVMWMRVHEWRMNVHVRVRLPSVPREVMVVPMMLVMHMGMRVFQWRVNVQVRMALGDVQPDTDRHQNPRDKKLQGNGLTIHHDCQGGAEEGRNREVRSGAGGTQIAQSEYEQRETDSVACESYGGCCHNRPPGWNRRTEKQRHADIHEARDHSLNACNDHSIACRYLAGQVVIDGPAKTGADD